MKNNLSLLFTMLVDNDDVLGTLGGLFVGMTGGGPVYMAGGENKSTSSVSCCSGVIHPSGAISSFNSLRDSQWNCSWIEE
jgi:hypothetical protein